MTVIVPVRVRENSKLETPSVIGVVKHYGPTIHSSDLGAWLLPCELLKDLTGVFTS